MNVGDERSRSFWMCDCSPIGHPALDSDAEADVAVIGGGIAGLSTAYELSRHGRSVILIDRGPIGWGMTARTTAHLASELDDYYHEAIRVHGVDRSRLYYQSQVAAINRVEAIVAEAGIDCDFARVDGYLIAATPDDSELLRKEYDACGELAVDIEWTSAAPVPGIDSGRALRFPNQARFHPLKYLHGLAREITSAGGKLYADTAYVSSEEADEGVIIHTEQGPTIRARAAVFATNSPVNDKVVIHSKQIPRRTYVIAGSVPRGSVADALLWDTLEAYHYVRLQPLDDADDLLIVGGEDHRSGDANDMDERLRRLEQWTRERYPTLASVQYRWSGQVMEPADYLPFSGRNPGNRNVYIHSGDSGQGITNGVAASLVIAPLILGEDSRFALIFEPTRVSPSAARELVEGVAGAVANLTEYLRPGEITSEDDLRPGQGAILRRSLHKIAAYRSEDGALIEHSATCTHVGCVVHWNSFERCWDCPCHGSQFAPDGTVLNGPALRPLAKASSNGEPSSI
jgi:glycine/D-amino acid oxidase-like deaminating enzyme/nitrite reductase/ring-hydroxylating ferredoxin subunit